MHRLPRWLSGLNPAFRTQWDLLFTLTSVVLMFFLRFASRMTWDRMPKLAFAFSPSSIPCNTTCGVDWYTLSSSSDAPNTRSSTGASPYFGDNLINIVKYYNPKLAITLCTSCQALSTSKLTPSRAARLIAVDLALTTLCFDMCVNTLRRCFIFRSVRKSMCLGSCTLQAILLAGVKHIGHAEPL